MDEAAITEYILNTFDDVEAFTTEGVTFFFYDPEQKFPFATLVTQDNDYDRASNLDRPTVFRLNIGVSPDTYQSMFGPRPKRAGESGAVDTGHDFTALDELMPHPVYAPMSWICVLNPSPETFEAVRPLLAEAYQLDVAKHTRRASRY
ncbi:MAG: hypothetical protein H6659_15080 [Ardenticatenaceae bacterium]|nr:hypothetical protein [Ardenticatenaceae bacterium]MCB8986695.1 hypothetical protein [Ardenticatenaceae bacterium]